jgi:hypothetical protein
VISDKNVVERGSSEPFDRRTIRISCRTTRVDLGIAKTRCQTLWCTPITDDREARSSFVIFDALQFIDVIIQKIITVLSVVVGREETRRGRLRSSVKRALNGPCPSLGPVTTSPSRTFQVPSVLITVVPGAEPP